MTEVLIAGGGIAGPVTAMALRAAGVNATVYEAYSAPADDVGAFLMLFTNGLEALRTIGAHQPVLDAGFPAEHVEVCSPTGELLGSRPTSGADVDGAGVRTAAVPHTLNRATLYRVLVDEAARRGVTVQHGRRLTGARQQPDGSVTADFADGSTAHGDVLAGADGLHSTVRGLIAADAPRPRHTGQITVCGYAADVAPELAPPAGTYRMYRGSRASFGCTTAPDGELWWFANTPGTELSRQQLAAVTPEQWRERVAALFDDDGTPVARMVRATGRIVGSNAYDLARTPHWHGRRMVLLGDAAHAAAPNAAQGASLAIEDGVILAKCLRDLPDPGTAFTAYEQLRRERVERVVARSAALSERSVSGAADQSDREGEARQRETTGGQDSSWQTDYRIDWDEPVAQPR